jgi:hypothetical protein
MRMDRCVLVYWYSIYKKNKTIIFNRRETINFLRLIFLYG